jgi:hypothetical protein
MLMEACMLASFEGLVDMGTGSMFGPMEIAMRANGLVTKLQDGESKHGRMAQSTKGFSQITCRIASGFTPSMTPHVTSASGIETQCPAKALTPGQTLLSTLVNGFMGKCMDKGYSERVMDDRMRVTGVMERSMVKVLRSDETAHVPEISGSMAK